LDDNISTIQKKALLHAITLGQLKALVEIVHNLLHSEHIKLTPTLQGLLRKYIKTLRLLGDKAISNSRKKKILTLPAVTLVLKAIANIIKTL
jgi:hypothetical protein